MSFNKVYFRWFFCLLINMKVSETMRLCGTDSQLSSEPITSEEQSISHEQKTLKRNALLMFFLTAKSVKIKRFQLFNTSLGWSSSISWWGGQTYDNHLVGVQVKLQPQINFSYWTWLTEFFCNCLRMQRCSWCSLSGTEEEGVCFYTLYFPDCSPSEQRWRRSTDWTTMKLWLRNN